MTQKGVFQIVRATTAVRTSKVWADGELVRDTDLGVLFMGDGVTSGGVQQGVSGGSVTELNDLSDVNTGGAGSGQGLVFNGTLWVPQDLVNTVQGQSGAVSLDSGDVPEGSNLYYTEPRVSANASVAANTAKVSADGPVSSHSDVAIGGISSGQRVEWNGSALVPTSAPQGKQIATYSNTNTLTNINTASFTDVPLTGTQVRLDGVFALSGSGIQCNFTGLVLVTYVVHYFSTGQRSALQSRIRVAGSEVGPTISTGYVRNSSGHNEASLSLSWPVAVTSGQTITIAAQRESTVTTSCTLAAAGTSGLSLMRLE